MSSQAFQEESLHDVVPRHTDEEATLSDEVKLSKDKDYDKADHKFL